MSNTAFLVLENGMKFEGKFFGARGEVTGELVFTTGMTGYLETLTDPSYYGQIVLQTFPLIGNYGVIPSDFESAHIYPRAYIVKYPCQDSSNFRSQGNIDTFLKERGVIGLCGIDTRALTKIIRGNGVMNGRIMGYKPTDMILDDIKSYKVCNVKLDCVIENITLPSLYEAPLMLHNNGLDEVVCRELGIKAPKPNLNEWKTMAQKIASRNKTVNIAIVGKYVKLHDAYLSIIESLNHAGFETGAVVNIRWVDSEIVSEENISTILEGIDGIIVPGGFGDRGIEGKITTCRFAREYNIPFLGICLGMQIAVIEFARNVCNLAGANSSEFDKNTAHPVIDLMPGQIGMVGSGGTMRLGAYPCKLAKDSLLFKLYDTDEISERHRHRFEFNNDYREILTSKGLLISGLSPDSNLVEAIELPDKEFFTAVQFHPEFKSRPNRPHPLFLGLLTSALKLQEVINEKI